MNRRLGPIASGLSGATATGAARRRLSTSAVTTRLGARALRRVERYDVARLGHNPTLRMPPRLLVE
jgi:hypothetical protein